MQKILLATAVVFALTGCNKIVKEYTPSQLDSLMLGFSGEGTSSGNNRVVLEDEAHWTCKPFTILFTSDIKGRQVSTKIEAFGRIFRSQSTLNDHGRYQTSHDLGEYNLNFLGDIQRQAVKFSISNNTSVDSGCNSGWEPFTI